MLTNEQIQQNKLQYFDLLAQLNIDLTELTKYLAAVDYFNQPATAKAFRAYQGGLCQYAIDLCFELGNLCNAYCPGKYTKEDIIKVALFRDLYRAEMYSRYLRNVQTDTGEWASVEAYKLKEERPTFGDLGFSSYMIAKHFISLTDEQIEAICLSRPVDYKTDNTSDIHDVLRSYKLVTLTRMADLAVMFLGEN